MQSINILEKIKHTEGCILTGIDPLRRDAYRSMVPENVPEDLASVLLNYYEVEIFSTRGKIPHGPNTWSIGSDFFSDASTIASFFGPPAPEDAYMAEYHELFYRLGNSECDGSEMIGISLHPSSLGMIFYYRIDAYGAPVGMPKIAESFTEWVERTIAAGPYARNAYWAEPDFIDLGPAIPNDPYYKPFGRPPLNVTA